MQALWPAVATANKLSSIGTSLDRVVKELGNKKESNVFADLRKSLNHGAQSDVGNREV